MLEDMFTDLNWRWELFGLLGEGLFFARLIVQWVHSERARRPVLPVAYWYMSLVGSFILVAYAFHKQSFVFLLPQFIGIPMYARNLQLELRHRAMEADRRVAGFDAPDFAWPRISVIVPCHNEAKVLATTLETLCTQHYPGPKPEVIVALNGCTDASWAVAQGFNVRVVESEKCGMSFGKNLGARAAAGEMLVFVDADTTLAEEGLQVIAECLHGCDSAVATMAGRPDRGGPVVRTAFLLANRDTCKRKVHAPGGVMAMHRQVFDKIQGFDESLPQGTSTDFIMRAQEAGAEYVFIDRTMGTTSIRRFEHTGIVHQMLEWRKNHKEIVRGQRDKVAGKEYKTVR